MCSIVISIYAIAAGSGFSAYSDKRSARNGDGTAERIDAVAIAAGPSAGGGDHSAVYIHVTAQTKAICPGAAGGGDRSAGDADRAAVCADAFAACRAADGGQAAAA
ncbi:hypothetical protein SDC9_167249 [bioreactor metagenome]|uniref:Uncharacterized protein n=1 Tax=bioreactor metagenome TaxID=1076179 RepID=A0A645G6Y8_9ZZZZ